MNGGKCRGQALLLALVHQYALRSTAVQRLLSAMFGCGIHGDRHQAVVGRSEDALGESRLSDEQRLMVWRIPHHRYL